MRFKAEASWKDVMGGLLDGVERELRPSAPARVKISLKAFRRRLDAKRTRGGQKHFGRQLEALLQRDRILKAAAKRHLEKEGRRVLKATIATLKRTKRVLEKVSERCE